MFKKIYCKQPFKKRMNRCDHIRICWYCGCDANMQVGGIIDLHGRVKCEDPNCY